MKTTLARKVLITGHAGSGKTFLQRYLVSVGVPAEDMDTIPNMARWIDETGNPVPFPANADEGWFR